MYIAAAQRWGNLLVGEAWCSSTLRPSQYAERAGHFGDSDTLRWCVLGAEDAK
jgi:hypothetical protein